jgi:hypothetical protein
MNRPPFRNKGKRVKLENTFGLILRSRGSRCRNGLIQDLTLIPCGLYVRYAEAPALFISKDAMN